MEKIVLAIGEDDLFEFKYGGVIWKIKPLPSEIKKRIAKISHVALSDTSKIGDLIDSALEAIKYSLKGFSGLKFRDGTEAVCTLVKDKDGHEILDKKTLDLIYRSSAFDTLQSYCVNPNVIPQYMLDNVNFSNEENLAPPSLEDKKK